RAEDAQVRTGAERPAPARDGDHANALAAAQPTQRRQQLVAHGAVERVQLLRTVEGHPPDAVGDLHQDALGRRHHARSTTIAMPWSTPMHIVTSPKRALVRPSAWTSVVSRRAPVAPSGCPSAIAPP